MGKNYAKIDKPCSKCGKMLYGVVIWKKYCPECAKEMNRLNSSKSNKSKRKGVKALNSPIYNPYAKYCRGCHYYGGHCEGCFTCNYIFMEGHRRPCPPGKGCTVKRKKEVVV